MPDTVTQQEVEDTIRELDIQTITLCEKKHTIVCALLQNGFTIIQTSTCVSADNYDESIGAEICIKKIKDQIWAYLGYELSTTRALALAAGHTLT